jgi:hypothetical protein
MGRKGFCAFVFEEDGLGCPRLVWLALPCFLSLALCAAGLVQLSRSSEGARERSVSAYNAAARAWDAAAPPPLPLSPVFVSAWRAGEAAASANASALFPLSSAAEDAHPPVDGDEGVRPSTRHFVLSHNSSAGSGQSAVSLALAGAGALDRQLYLAVSRPPQPQPSAGVPFYGAFSWETKPCLSKDTSAECRARCAALGAAFRAGVERTDLSVCTRVLVLAEVCLVARDLDAAAPVLDADNGCALNNDATRESPNLQSGRNSAHGPIGPFLFTQLPPGAALPAVIAPKITVRSALDPWVVALRLSHGTGSFGVPASRLAASGISLLVPGLVLGPLLYLCCFAHHAWQHRGDDAGAGGGDGAGGAGGGGGSGKVGQGSVAEAAAPAPPPRDAPPELALELQLPQQQQQVVPAAGPVALPLAFAEQAPPGAPPPPPGASAAAAAAVAAAESGRRVAEAEAAQLRAQVEAVQLKRLLQQQQQQLLWEQQQLQLQQLQQLQLQQTQTQTQAQTQGPRVGSDV